MVAHNFLRLPHWNVVAVAAIALLLRLSSIVLLHVIKAQEFPFDVQHELYNDLCIRPSHWRAEENRSEVDRISLILHASADQIHLSLMDQVTNWSGPVSMAIFIDNPRNEINCVEDTIGALRDQSDTVRQYLTVHYVYKHCSEHCGVVAEPCSVMGKKKPLRQIADYPANALRNIAREFSLPYKYILIADLEHLFSQGFEKRMLELVQRLNIRKIPALLVYRIFEIDKDVREPKDKKDLNSLISNGKAVTFHSRFSHENPHYIEGEADWLRKAENLTHANIASIVRFSSPKWEPQFVSTSVIPYHDEGFPYRIRDNTSLRWELCRAGYLLYIVEDLFAFHRGIKQFDRAEKEETRLIQHHNLPRYRKALHVFVERMDKQYPSTKEQCPVCNYFDSKSC